MSNGGAITRPNTGITDLILISLCFLPDREWSFYSLKDRDIFVFHRVLIIPLRFYNVA